MNAGPGGFGHAPVTKGLVLASVGSSIIANAARASHRSLPQPLVLASNALAFRTPGELLFGCVLLYYLRVLEREAGSRKYGSYAAAVTGLSYALQLAASSALRLRVPLAPGPLPLVFASLVPVLLDVPPTSHFTVLGCRMSDKAFVYLAGLQLLLASGRQSLLALAASALAGVLYRLNFCSIKKFRLPSPLVGLVSRALGPLLVDQRSSGPSIILVGGAAQQQQQQQDAVAPGGHAGVGSFGDGFYQGAEAAMGNGRGATGAGGLRQRHGGRGGGGGGGAASALVGRLPDPDPEVLQSLLAMGFTHERAAEALQQAGNDLQTAIALLVG